MGVDLLEEIVRKALRYADQACTFAFQGGGPILARLDFYKSLMEFEKKYNNKKVRVNNAIQTNGFDIDEKWVDFFAKHNFLVGISLDGPKDIHDLNRINSKKDGSFKKVMSTVALLNKYKVEYNILSVITGHAARHVSKIYSFYKSSNFRYLQFIPCIDPLDMQRGSQ